MRAWLATAATVTVAACSGASPAPALVPPPRPIREPHPRAHQLHDGDWLGDLALLLPHGAGAIVVARPREIFADDALREVLEVVVPPAEEARIEARTGVRVSELREVAFGQYADGWIAILRGPNAGAEMVLALASRLETAGVVSDDPFLVRTGALGPDVYEFLAVARDVAVLAKGDGPGPAAHRALRERLHADRWPEGAGGALSAGAPARVVAEHRARPVLLVAPEPLELPPGFGTSVLLARERALAASLEAGEGGRLGLAITLDGEFPPGAAANFRELVGSVARSDLGRALGLEAALPTLRIQEDDGRVRIDLALDARTLAGGLRLVFVAEIRELLGPG